MKRGTKCIARTINLSDPESCVRPKVVQKLVRADVTRPCPDLGPSSTAYRTPKPVSVNICTPQEMRRTCPPKLCDCPQKPPPKSPFEKLRSTLFLLLKAGIAAGLVYWTNSEGLWGKGEETEELYYRIIATIAPALPDGTEVNDTSLPHLEGIKYAAIQRYNGAVYAITNTIVRASTKLSDRIQDVLFPCEDNENATGTKSSRGARDVRDED